MIYLYFGNDTFNSHRELNLHREKFIKDNPGARVDLFDVEDLDGPRRPSFSALSLFNSPQLFVIKRFFDLPASKRDSLWEDIVNAKDDVILWQDGSVDKRTKIFKYIEKNGTTELFETPKGVKLKTWIEKEAKSLGLKISPDVEEILLSRYEDCGIIYSELLKLKTIQSLSKKQTIDKSDLEVLSQGNADLTWKFIDYFFSKNKVKALTTLEGIHLQTGEDIGFIGLLASQLRNIFLVKSYGNVYNAQDSLATKLRIHPFVLKKCVEFSKNFTIERLRILYTQLTRLDYTIKYEKMNIKLGLSLIIASL